MKTARNILIHQYYQRRQRPPRDNDNGYSEAERGTFISPRPSRRAARRQRVWAYRCPEKQRRRQLRLPLPPRDRQQSVGARQYRLRVRAIREKNRRDHSTGLPRLPSAVGMTISAPFSGSNAVSMRSISTAFTCGMSPRQTMAPSISSGSARNAGLDGCREPIRPKSGLCTKVTGKVLQHRPHTCSC